MYYIYMIYSKINGKVYIGQTKRPEARWADHIRDTNKVNTKSKRVTLVIHLAMNKYGIENFEFFKIQKLNSIERANIAEIAWIKFFNSTDRDFGYNISNGGGVITQTKEVIQKAQLTKNNRTLEEKENIKYKTKRSIAGWSKEKKNKFSQDISIRTIGKNLSQETKEKIKVALTANPNNFKNKLNESKVLEIIKLYNEEKLLPSEIAKQFKVTANTIRKIIRGKIWIHVTKLALKKIKDPNFNKGENSKVSKIKTSQAEEILKIHSTKKYTLKEISKKLNISIHIVTNIVFNRTWKHIDRSVYQSNTDLSSQNN